jgi:hypothetical protein
VISKVELVENGISGPNHAVGRVGFLYEPTTGIAAESNWLGLKKIIQIPNV